MMLFRAVIFLVLSCGVAFAGDTEIGKPGHVGGSWKQTLEPQEDCQWYNNFCHDGDTQYAVPDSAPTEEEQPLPDGLHDNQRANWEALYKKFPERCNQEAYVPTAPVPLPPQEPPTPLSPKPKTSFPATSLFEPESWDTHVYEPHGVEINLPRFKLRLRF